MKNNSSPKITKVERDPQLFMWFMTLVIAAMYVVTLIEVPPVRQPGTLIVFTLLVSIHIILHWRLEKITAYPIRTMWYIVAQGILALIISWMAGSLGMMFALFMALLGESVGLYGLTRPSLLAGVYYLVLLIISLVQFSGWASSWMLILSVGPMVFFVVIYVTLYMRQLDARERAQHLATELEEANRQLAEYVARVEDLTIANERQRMARELHDTLSQGLAGIILQLEAVEAHLSNNRPEKAQNIIANAKTQARATLSDARAAIDDLRQVAPDDLDSALRLEISRFTDATGISCDYRADSAPLVPDPVKETVIRAVAEGLNNIARHAQARQATVNLSASDQSLMVTIQDDGQGFDADEIPSGHYGLLGVRERIRLVNGTLDIQSEKRKGTTLKVTIPILSPNLGEGQGEG